MDGLKWFGIGDHADYRNPLAKNYAESILKIQDFIRETSPQKTDEELCWFFDQCWVLAGTNKMNFRDFVREIVVPEHFYKEAEKIVNSIDFASARPKITVLPQRWRIALKDGVPQIL